MFRTSLMIVFSFLLFSGCVSPFGNKNKFEWPMPKTPAKESVKTIPLYKGKEYTFEKNGIFIDEESALNLLKNINELDVYTEKLEILIKEMKRYYGAK